jgi:hypothetical protein
MPSFNHEEFEAAKRAQQLQKNAGTRHPPSQDQLSRFTTDRNMEAQGRIPDHPDILQELSATNPNNTFDLAAFCQGAAGEADQRYLNKQLHASRIAVDPAAEQFMRNQQRASLESDTTERERRDSKSAKRGERSSSSLEEPSTFMVLLQVIFVSVLVVGFIVFFSSSFLPGLTFKTMVWLSQVSTTVLVGMYFARR